MTISEKAFPMKKKNRTENFHCNQRPQAIEIVCLLLVAKEIPERRKKKQNPKVSLVGKCSTQFGKLFDSFRIIRILLSLFVFF